MLQNIPSGHGRQRPWQAVRVHLPAPQHTEICTKVPVACPRCGIVIGQKDRYDAAYYTPRYSGTEANEYYGGAYNGAEYCTECYEELLMTEDCLP